MGWPGTSIPINLAEISGNRSIPHTQAMKFWSRHRGVRSSERHQYAAGAHASMVLFTLIASGDSKWDESIIAWGLNVAVSDRAVVNEDLTHSYSEMNPMLDQCSTIDLTTAAIDMETGRAAYMFDGFHDLFGILDHKVEPMFPPANVTLPRFWRESAIADFSLQYRSTALAERMSHSHRKCRPKSV